MKSTYVFATAESRLHADVMMIRLRRAEIEIDRVSAVFSGRFAPNSFFFWLRRPRVLQSDATGESFFAAGSIQRLFASADGVENVTHKLRGLGVERAAADRLGRSLSMGHALLCVQAKHQDETAVAWHIFKHAGAENIAVTAVPAAEAATEPRLAAPELAAVAA